MYSHIYDIGFLVISREEDASDVTPDLIRASLIRRLLELEEDRHLLEAVSRDDNTIEVDDDVEAEPLETKAVASVARLLWDSVLACGREADADEAPVLDGSGAHKHLVEYSRHRITADDLLRALPVRPSEGKAQEWAFRSGITDGYRSESPAEPLENPHLKAAYEYGHLVGVAQRAFHGSIEHNLR
jgi:hypothetical protein